MDDLLQQGITAYKAGKRDEAHNIFITVVKQSPDSQSAWAWLYDASNNDQERIHCLKQIVRINPNNEKAKQKLASFTGQGFPLAPSQNATSPTQEQNSGVSRNVQNKQPANSEPTAHPWPKKVLKYRQISADKMCVETDRYGG